jgi:Pectate lyase superfamily protein
MQPISALMNAFVVTILLATALQAARPAYPLKSVADYGAVGDGLADDTRALQAALDDAEGRCIHFPAGVYRHSRFLNLRASNSCVIGDPGAVLSNVYPDTSGPLNDGIRVGDASPRDGGTGTGINIHDVYIAGLGFDSQGRIGVWVVYGRRITVEAVSGAGQAVVAVGNDADDECEDIEVRNVVRTGPTTSDWYTVGIFNTQRFLLDGVWSTHAVGSQALAINGSRNGTVRNVVIDQVDGLHDGIALLDARQVSVTAFHVRRARKGVVIYSDFLSKEPGADRQENHVGPGTVTEAAMGVHIYSRFNTVERVFLNQTGQGIVEGIDARQNHIEK